MMPFQFKMDTAKESPQPDRLEWALDFVTGRIREQAQFLAEPLDEEEEETLANLPHNYALPSFSIKTGAGSLISPDHAYDKLVRLARSAVDSDRNNVPERTLQWELADIICG
jgi:hypothetical protein